jgi:hypothetical protein
MIFKQKYCLMALTLGVLNLCNISGQNILKNSSFENIDMQTQRPFFWNTMQRLTLDKHHEIDSKTARTGKYSVKIHNSNPAVGTKSYILWKQSSLSLNSEKYPPGTEMTFAVYAKTSEPATRFRIYLEAMSGLKFTANAISAPLKGSSEWQRFSINFKIPEKKITSLYVCMQLLNTGTIWFDDAWFGKKSELPDEKVVVDSGQNVIVNSSFEKMFGGKPAHWSTFQLNAPGKFHSVATDKAHTGIRSAKISGSDNINSKNFVMWKQANLQKRLKDIKPGTKMQASIWVNTASNPSVKFRFYVEMRHQGKFIGTFISPPLSTYVGWEKKELNFEMPKIKPDSVYICLQLLTSGEVWFDDVQLRKAADISKQEAEKSEKRFLRAVNFPSQNTYYLPSVPKQLDFTGNIKDKVKIDLFDGKGNLIKDYILEKGNFKINLPALTMGNYSIIIKADGFHSEELFRIREKDAKGIRFTDNNKMIFHGKEFFPVIAVTPAMSEKALQVYSKIGFNTICFSGLTSDAAAAKYLSGIAGKYGLATISWSNFGDLYRKNDKDFAETVANNVKVAKTLPNFIGWLDDESEHRSIPLKSLQRTYKSLYKLAPEFIFWQNHAPRLTAVHGNHGTPDSVRLYSKCSDVTGLDIYPVPETSRHNDLANRTIACVGEYTDLVSASVHGRKPIWMVLQASSWSEMSGRGATASSPRPNYHQLRFMIYNAITHGATGIALFGTKGLADIHSPFMAMLGDLLLELKAVSPFLLSDCDMRFHLSGDIKDIRVSAKKLDEGMLLTIVNESKQDKIINIDLKLEKLNRMFKLPDGKAVELKNGKISLKLAANQVIILSERKIVIPKTPVFSKNNQIAEQIPSVWKGQWVAHPKHFRTADKTTFAKFSFRLDKQPEKASILVAGDDAWKMQINGCKVGSGSNNTRVFKYSIKEFLHKGDNEIRFELYNIVGPSALMYECEITTSNKKMFFVSDKTTMFSEDGKNNWQIPYVAGTPPIRPWGPIKVIISANKTI